MEANGALARLRVLPLFAGLGDDALHRVQGLAVELEVPAGEVLARASEAATGLFVIEEGTVVVESPGTDMIELGAGEFVGELALLVPDAVRSAWVRAKTDVRCLAIDRADFEQLLQDEPTIALAMLPIVARRLWRTRRAG
jgi:CRP/FNR family transcriptional regulator, cyclic AMP receptor protein